MVVGIGSNLGDRYSLVAWAFSALEALPDVVETRRSSIWETEPVGGPPQPRYLNAAFLGWSLSAPDVLLAQLQAIERRAGRIRSEPNAPRTLDLDLLWIEGETVRKPNLVVPHPRLSERAFALVPLLEVAPDAMDPGTQEPYERHLARVGSDGVTRAPPK